MRQVVKILKQGDKADIFVYADHRGKTPALAFIRALDKSAKFKAFALIERFAKHGEIQNTEQFRVEESPIYALKSSQVRILCFFLPDARRKSLVLTHGFKKKSQKMNPAELDKAKRIYTEVVSICSAKKE